MPSSSTDTSAAIHRIDKTVSYWKNLYRLWWAIHYGIGVIGVACAVLAGAAGAENNPAHNYLWLLGIVGAVSTSLITFLGPVQKAEKYWRGFHIAEQVLLEFESGECNMKKVVRQVELARRVVLIGVEPHDEQAKSVSPS
jgi:hypothetical protein